MTPETGRELYTLPTMTTRCARGKEMAGLRSDLGGDDNTWVEGMIDRRGTMIDIVLKHRYQGGMMLLATRMTRILVARSGAATLASICHRLDAYRLDEGLFLPKTTSLGSCLDPRMLDYLRQRSTATTKCAIMTA